MIVTCRVGVALRRPPRTDRYARVVVTVPAEPDGSNLYTAELAALRLAHDIASARRDVVMVTENTIERIEL